jgi:hypothetical protein
LKSSTLAIHEASHFFEGFLVLVRGVAATD